MLGGDRLEKPKILFRVEGPFMAIMFCAILEVSHYQKS